MALSFILVLLMCVALIQAMVYLDDRDGSIVYTGRNNMGGYWERLRDDAAYQGTLTDNNCYTIDYCRVVIPFTGSGITIYVAQLDKLQPLNASIVLDGNSNSTTFGVFVPDQGSAYNITLFDKQGLVFGAHSLNISLITYNEGMDNATFSHMWLDKVAINDTNTTLTSTAATSNASSTSSGTSAAQSSNWAVTTSSREIIRAAVGRAISGLVFATVAITVLF